MIKNEVRAAANYAIFSAAARVLSGLDGMGGWPMTVMRLVLSELQKEAYHMDTGHPHRDIRAHVHVLLEDGLTDDQVRRAAAFLRRLADGLVP